MYGRNNRKVKAINRNALYRASFTLMRIKGANIHTTQNASFPIEHAKKAFAAIRHCKETASEWKRNGKSIHLGNFQIDTIESNGNVKAGCHYIEWDEIARIARQLDIYPHKAGDHGNVLDITTIEGKQHEKAL